MNFLISFVNTFLVDYFFIFIINLLPVKNKLKWQVGVISLTNLPAIFFDIYQVIVLAPQMGVNVLVFAGVTLSKILAYIAIMVWLLQGRKIFKSRRQRQFEREYKGNTKNNIIASSILLILSLVSLGFTVYLFLNYTSDLLFTIIGAVLAFILLLGFGIYLLPFNTLKNLSMKTKKPNRLLFILKIKDSQIVFESEFKENLEYYLNTLADDFVLSNHGLIEQDKTIYLCKGIKVDYIDKSVVKGIKMNICKNEKLIEICSTFNQYQQKYIKLDTNYNIISEKTE